MKRQRIRTIANGQTEAFYEDLGPSRAVVGHGRPMREIAATPGGMIHGGSVSIRSGILGRMQVPWRGTS